jgi:Bacterial regulatory proteins, luxR family
LVACARGGRGKLFISPKTVEVNLARVFRMLDVHSRAELAAETAHGCVAAAQTDQTDT